MNRVLNNKFSFIGKIILTVVISVAFSLTVARQYFQIVEPYTRICIEDTATKNNKSFGTDVRLQSLKIDGQKIPFDKLDYGAEWENLGDLLITVNPPKPVFINYDVENAQTIELIFQTQEGSGVVEISANDRVLGKLDLYSAEWGETRFTGRLARISIFSNWKLFIFICGIIFMILNYLSQVKIEGIISKYIKCTIGPCSILLMVSIYFNEFSKFVWLVLLIEALGIAGCDIREKIKSKQDIWTVLFHSGYVLLITAIILFFAVEQINNNLGNIEVKYVIGNVSIYFTILTLGYLIFSNIRIAVLIGELLTFLYGTANYYVTLFRGSPIVPGDFFVLQTAKSVAANYHYSITWNLQSAFWVLLIWTVSVWVITTDNSKVCRKKTVYVTFPVAVLISMIINSDFYRPVLNYWELNQNVKQYGTFMSLLSNINRMKMEKPEGYSQETVERLAKEYEQEEDEENTQPNIVVIMNESFSDLSVLSDEISNEEYMPYYNSLKDNVQKGMAYVSTVGGGTCNTEYEFLTGNSMAFLPGTFPFQQFVLKESLSIVRSLKEEGYYTVGIHPYKKEGYNRVRVYPYLGFDEFLDIEAFESPELSRNIWISDKESYKKVIEVFEDKKKQGMGPGFIFNVTMQNHSGYSTGFFGEDGIKIPGREGKFPDAEEYLRLMKESDDALSVLLDYFGQIEEPTVILFFGDHQPKIDISFYEEMLGKPMAEWSLEETQKRFVVPFFIWANYDINEREEIETSMNYLSSILFETAGISVIPYQNYLSSLREDIPAININGYRDKNRIWHTHSEKTEWSPELSEYWCIQYNNMFDRNKCKEWFSSK